MTTQTEKFQLYHYDGCFFCTMVREAAGDLGVQLELRNIHDNPSYKKDLIDFRGRQTVPVLRIVAADGRVEWLPESRDIVRYLRERFGDPNSAPSLRERSTDVMAFAPWVLIVVGVLASGTARFALVVAGLSIVGVRGLTRTRPSQRGERVVGVLALGVLAIIVAAYLLA